MPLTQFRESPGECLECYGCLLHLFQPDRLEKQGRPLSAVTEIFPIVLTSFQLLLTRIARNRADDKESVGVMDLIVTSEDGRYSISRLQIYLWTFAVVVGFGAVFMSGFKFTIPDIPAGLIALMGISHGAYLGTKAAAKKVE